MAYLTLNYKSFAQMKGVTIRAFIPDAKILGLDPNPLKTVYFLNGFSGDSLENVTYFRFRRQCELKNIAVVLVDGENKFYIDHPERYESYSTFVGKEVVDLTRRLLPLSDKKEDTFIAGISMGGYGALYNGLKFKDTFGKVVALSPATDLYEIMEQHPEAGFQVPQLENLFGKKEDYINSEWCLNHFYSAENLEGAPDILVCCGEQDRLVNPQAKLFAEKIRETGYSCEFLGGKGDHEVDYWERCLDPMFSFLAGIPAGSRDDILQMLG